MLAGADADDISVYMYSKTEQRNAEISSVWLLGQQGPKGQYWRKTGCA